MTFKELRDTLLQYAMAADHAFDPKFTVGGYDTIEVNGSAYRRHAIYVSLPEGIPATKSKDAPIWLFKRLIEALDESEDELLDHFATKLMERLQERQKADRTSQLVKNPFGLPGVMTK